MTRERNDWSERHYTDWATTAPNLKLRSNRRMKETAFIICIPGAGKGEERVASMGEMKNFVQDSSRKTWKNKQLGRPKRWYSNGF